ncbi:MAG: hypothetical protein Q4F29_10015, partial [Lachnospiraceae bacterium]|nr:hypothetical protein [Lachnospiraceae bacterium]
SSPAETTSPADSPAETTRAGSAASSGAAETTAASGAAVETDFEADGYAETYLNYNDGHTIWSVWGGASESGSVVFKTAGFESKNGFYASLTLTLDACADMQILADNMEITYFDVSTKVNTAVNALAGYHMGGSAQPRIQLPTCVIPVSGPITMTVKPYLVVNAEGEFTVEATADLTNDIGFHYTYLNGSSDLETVNDTNVVVDFKAEAEGSLETGPEFQVDLGLCGTPFFDGAAVISGTGFSGFGISGKTAVEQQVSVSNQSAGYRGHQTALDADGNRHVCLLCIQGDAYMVDRLTIGLGEEINEVIKKLVNKEITYQVPELVHVLTPWHYSAGIDYGPEFELQKCPHIAYPITLTALDEELQEPLEGVNILVSGEPEALVTAADGTAQLWKENGVYHVTASLEHYEPNPLKGSVTVAAGKESKALYLKARVEGVVVSGPIGEYDGVTYSERTVPGLTRLSVKPEKERYVCSFAFYKDRLYYACKDAGTSDYSSAIYSCRPDGSDQKLLVEYPGTWDLNGHYENYDTCTEFVILDDCLYPGSREEQCIDLNTLESRPSDQPSDRLARRYFQKRIPMFSYAEDVTYYVSWELGDRKEIHRIRNGEDQVIWRESSWISLLGADRDSLYFSTSNGQEVTLYRLDIHQMQKSAMDSHMEAGGGGYFNW